MSGNNIFKISNCIKIKYLIIFFSVFLFLLLKFLNLSLIYGDGGVYMYIAGKFTQGLLPYKDFFTSDPPFLTLFLAPFAVIFKKKLIMFQVLIIILESINSLLIYKILDKLKVKLAFIAPLIYLFSFSIYSTSDYLTGVQITTFFTLLAIFCQIKNKNITSGLLWSAAIMTKPYSAPAFIGFLIYFLIQKDFKKVKKILLGFLCGSLVIIAPFLIVAPYDLFKSVIIHNINRQAGLNKFFVLYFFLKREWFIIATAAAGIILSKYRETKLKIFIFPLMLTVLSILSLKDIYYVYLNSFLLYLFIYSVYFISTKINKKIDLYSFLIILIYVVFLISSLSYYSKNFAKKGKFKNAKEIAQYVKTLKDNKDLYGSHEVVPIIAILAEKKIFNNYAETNPQGFGTGVKTVKEVSREAVKKGIYLIARTVQLPQYNIKDTGFEGYFSKELFKKYCAKIKEFKTPNTGDMYNSITIYKCKK